MREEFEKLPEIVERLKDGGIYWNGYQNKYQTDIVNLMPTVCYIDGSWYAFQEQQKKINAMYECMDEAIRLIDEGNSWDAKELLK